MIKNFKKLSKLSEKLSEKPPFDPKGLVDESFLDEDFPGFPFLVPKSFFKKINLKDKKDPLLLQVLPSKNEHKKISGFSEDPLNEKKHSKIPGLIHKYHGRVLLLVTDICAINCRFCFRRHMREKVTNWKKVYSYIKNDKSIYEVVLSGGDPLMMEPNKLKNIFNNLSSIDRVKRIRIHSRLPIVMPERVDSKLFQAKKPLVLVVHCNHPNEIDEKAKAKLKSIKKKNVEIFNQSVLLKNINDDAKTLIALSEKLFAAGVIPYYLHLLDKVKGSSHFFVGLDKAQKIYNNMKKKLSGYLVPKLVVEIQNRKKYV